MNTNLVINQSMKISHQGIGNRFFGHFAPRCSLNRTALPLSTGNPLKHATMWNAMFRKQIVHIRIWFHDLRKKSTELFKELIGDHHFGLALASMGADGTVISHDEINIFGANQLFSVDQTSSNWLTINDVFELYGAQMLLASKQTVTLTFRAPLNEYEALKSFANDLKFTATDVVRLAFKLLVDVVGDEKTPKQIVENHTDQLINRYGGRMMANSSRNRIIRSQTLTFRIPTNELDSLKRVSAQMNLSLTATARLAIHHVMDVIEI